MWPQIGRLDLFGHPLTFHAYGLLIGLGGTAWILLVAHETSRRGLTRMRERLALVLVVMVAAGWVGGKAFSAFLEPGDAAAALGSPGSGFVFYGSLLAALPALALVASRLGVHPLEALDVVATPAPLLHAFGRTGCFLAGCCYGHRCDLPWAVTFRHGYGLNGVPLHPVQLYEAAGLLAIFLWIWLRLRPRQRYRGQIGLAYLGAYSCLRITTELFRGDPTRKFVFGHPGAPGDPPQGISMSTLVSVLILAGSAVAWLVLQRRAGAARGSDAKV